MYRIVIAIGLWMSVVGCSSLGISLSPPQSYLTEQAEQLINRSTRNAMLPRELEMSVLMAHSIQPGDVLLIEPVELDSDVRFPADQKVLADGTVDLAKFGRVVLAGLTLERAENLIEQTIEASGEKATQVNVRLLESVHRIYVLGEVASPGIYPFTGNETVLDGILAAGGLTTQANPCKVVLARPTPPSSCRVALPICYREITQLGDTTTNYQLQPGDRIFVGSRTFCEELQFWNANKTCDRCCKCQFPCADPSVATFVNPITPNLPPPPIAPIFRSKKVDGIPAASSPGLIEQNNTVELPQPSVRRKVMPDPTRESQPSPRSEGQLEFDPPLQTR